MCVCVCACACVFLSMFILILHGFMVCSKFICIRARVSLCDRVSDCLYVIVLRDILVKNRVKSIQHLLQLRSIEMVRIVPIYADIDINVEMQRQDFHVI